MGDARGCAVLLCLAACKSDQPPGTLEPCGPGGTCPTGYECNLPDNLCYLKGASPDAAPVDAVQPMDAAIVLDAPPQGCDAITFGTRVQMELDSENAEWVTSLKWLDSAAV